jgi:type IV pilus assembly protein PilO
MSRDARNVLLLGFLAVVLLVVGFYFLLLGPLLSRLNEADQQRDTQEAQLAQVQQEVAELEEVRRNSPEIERQLLELSKRIPTQPEIPTLVVQMEEIARSSNVSQLSIEPGTPGPPPGGGDFSVVPVTLRFRGTYDEMQNFLLQTRNLVRLVTVTNLSYCRLGPTGDLEPLDPDHACEIEIEEAEEGVAGEGTVVDPTIEADLLVEIEAEVYYQPTDVPDGTAPVAPAAPETTTAAPEAE